MPYWLYTHVSETDPDYSGSFSFLYSYVYLLRAGSRARKACS